MMRAAITFTAPLWAGLLTAVLAGGCFGGGSGDSDPIIDEDPFPPFDAGGPPPPRASRRKPGRLGRLRITIGR